MRSIIEKIKVLFRNGLFHIMGSTVINKVIAFVTNIFLVRILTKYDNGIFSSAFNVFSIAALFSGFGISSATLYFASGKETEEERRTVYRFALRYGLIVNACLCLILLGYGSFGNVGIEETRKYIISLVPLPIISFFVDYYAIILRTRRENKKYALLLNINSGTYAIFAVLGSLFYGIPGTIAGRYVSYLVTAFIGYLFTRKYTRTEGISLILSPEKRRDVMKYAAFSGSVTALNNILYRIDLLLITQLIADATILSSYKVAALVPENANFIPQSILIVFLPLFIENQGNNRWVVEKAKSLFKYMALVCGALCLLMLFFSGIIVRILWGEQYLDGIPYFRVLAVSFFFLGVFRSTSTNILQALGKVQFNLLVSVIASIANIVLDIVMIHHWGAMGAAIATLSVTIIASIVSFPYLLWTLNKRKRIDNSIKTG